jgi:hypothetical protein
MWLRIARSQRRRLATLAGAAGFDLRSCERGELNPPIDVTARFSSAKDSDST